MPLAIIKKLNYSRQVNGKKHHIKNWIKYKIQFFVLLYQLNVLYTKCYITYDVVINNYRYLEDLHLLN